MGVTYDEMDGMHGRGCFPLMRWVLSLRVNRAHSARYACYPVLPFVPYMANAFRYGLLGVSDVNLAVAYLAMAGFIAALFWLALYLLNRVYGIRS